MAGERCSMVLMTIDWGAAATLVAGSATTIAGVFAKARIDRQYLVAQRANDVERDALLQLQERLGTLPDAYYGILNHAEEIVQNPNIEQGQFDEEDVYPFVYEATGRRREVELLATRIADDHLRQQVVNVIALIWPASTEQITAACMAVLRGTPETYPFPLTPPAAIDVAIANAVEAIGVRLRGAKVTSWRRLRR